MGRLKGVKQTGEVAKCRKAAKAKRESHKQAILTGTVRDASEPLIPEIFNEIKELYWECLKSVPDPRRSGQTIYPLYLILHRIISGFLGGTHYIGVLFPKSHTAGSDRTLGALPTRPVVYKLLRRIDWYEVNRLFSPLWEYLGYSPDLIIRNDLKDPREIIEVFKRSQKEAEAKRNIEFKARLKEEEREKKGLSAAQAKRIYRGNPVKKKERKIC